MCRNSEIRNPTIRRWNGHHGLMPLLSRAQLRDCQRSARSNFQKKTRLRAAPLLDGEAAVCLFGVYRRGSNLGVKTPFDLGISVVELPGIEPGSYGIPSRLLRAQFAMPLLGSLGHTN